MPAATNTPSQSQSDQRKDQVTKLTQKLGQELADSAALDPAATLPRHPVSVPLHSSPLLFPLGYKTLIESDFQPILN